MNGTPRQLLRCAALLVLPLLSISTVAHAQKWIDPTPEELSMTSQPEVPGAAAVYRDSGWSLIDRRYQAGIRAKF